MSDFQRAGRRIMALAIFDLDNTLLGGDSDYLWGRYLAENGIVDEKSYHQTNLAFYHDYQEAGYQCFSGVCVHTLKK